MSEPQPFTETAETPINRILGVADSVAINKKDSMPRLTLEQSIGTLIDNERFSDVRFIVGDSEAIVNGHKMLFALSSEVFEQMFYGRLKEQDHDIPIPDLTPSGFMNMVRFFYSKKVDVDISEIYETLEAATKYMVSDLILALHELVTRKLEDVSDSCFLFDQLIKIQSRFGNEALHQPLPTEDLKRVIEINCTRAFRSDSFENIAPETLIQILQFDKLNINEVDLLKSCIRHTEVELKRLELDATVANKRKVFANVKNLIRFTDLDVVEFGKIPGIEKYLNAEEVSSVFLHRCDASRPLSIEYVSPRNVLPICDSVTAYPTISMEIAFNRSLLIDFFGRVNEDVFISQLETSGLTQSCHVDLKIFENSEEMVIHYDIVQATTCLITFPIPLHLKQETIYHLNFRFSNVSNKNSRLNLSNNMLLTSTNGGAIKFTFENPSSKHCLSNISFYH